MLSYDDALILLHRYGGNQVWIRHCKAVACVAARVGALMEAKYDLDVAYLKAGALLHDIGRYKTHDPIMHGVEGYRLLTTLGHHDEAFICASHVLCGLPRSEASGFGLPDQDFLPVTMEQRLVPMIDSLVEFDRPTTLEKRVLSINQRYHGNTWFLGRMEQAAAKARGLLDELNLDLGISLEQVAAETLMSDY